jgi:hypothetical protein
LAKNGFRPAQPSFDVDDPVEQWRTIVATSPPRPGRADHGADLVLVVPDGDEPNSQLHATLSQAHAASNADIVTCAIESDTVEHYFLGDPGGLGVLGNMYGTVALMRRPLDKEPATAESLWPALARAAAAGARIVSVPLPLVRSRRQPATLEDAPAEAFAVVRVLESGDRRTVRSITRLAAGLAADLNEPRSAESANGLRRWTHGARRLFGRP